MEAFDTNVTVRLGVRDDEKQYGRAERVLVRARPGRLAERGHLRNGPAFKVLVGGLGSNGVGGHRIPRPIGEDRGGVITPVHPSPVKIWAGGRWAA